MSPKILPEIVCKVPRTYVCVLRHSLFCFFSSSFCERVSLCTRDSLSLCRLCDLWFVVTCSCFGSRKVFARLHSCKNARLQGTLHIVGIFKAGFRCQVREPIIAAGQVTHGRGYMRSEHEPPQNTKILLDHVSVHGCLSLARPSRPSCGQTTGKTTGERRSTHGSRVLTHGPGGTGMKRAGITRECLSCSVWALRADRRLVPHRIGHPMFGGIFLDMRYWKGADQIEVLR